MSWLINHAGSQFVLNLTVSALKFRKPTNFKRNDICISNLYLVTFLKIEPDFMTSETILAVDSFVSLLHQSFIFGQWIFSRAKVTHLTHVFSEYPFAHYEVSSPKRQRHQQQHVSDCQIGDVNVGNRFCLKQKHYCQKYDNFNVDIYFV